MMKLILEGDSSRFGMMMNLAFRIMAEKPDQKVGTSNAIVEKIDGQNYAVIRNQGSYTVKGPLR